MVEYTVKCALMISSRCAKTFRMSRSAPFQHMALEYVDHERVLKKRSGGFDAKG
jgi:hypothetical protein